MLPPLSSVKKTLRVLEAFSDDQTELGVTQIAELLKSHKSSISRILMTLLAEGFVEKNMQTNKYRLGLKMVELGYRALKRFDLKELATPFLEELANKTNEIIHLAVLDKNEIIYIDKRGKEQVLTVATRIGGRHPAYCSAMGKVLLAGLSHERLNEVLAMGPLRRFTPTTITQVPILRKELERVRKQGFAIDNEESFPGIQCVAAPIRNNQGEAVAAISATVPKLRMGKQRTKELIQLVTRCAQKISERMKSVR